MTSPAAFTRPLAIFQADWRDVLCFLDEKSASATGGRVVVDEESPRVR